MDQNFFNTLDGSYSRQLGSGILGGLSGLGQLGTGGLAPMGFQTVFDNDWHDYVYFSPPRNVLCQFWNSSRKWTGYGRDFAPEFNIANLQWRLTGIGKHQLGLLESN
jgi:hypothetical protein